MRSTACGRVPETFGICAATGRTIGFERLDALPHARYCIEHKRGLEAPQ